MAGNLAIMKRRQGERSIEVGNHGSEQLVNGENELRIRLWSRCNSASSLGLWWAVNGLIFSSRPQYLFSFALMRCHSVDGAFRTH